MTATTAKGLVFTAHPIVDVLMPPVSLGTQRAWLGRPGGEQQLLEYWQQHEGLIKDSADDPFNHGFELPFWPDLWAMIEAKDETYALGGNGPGKTEIGAKLVVKTLTKRPGLKILCISQNQATSKQNQQ